jgi:hypothetical protein
VYYLQSFLRLKLREHWGINQFKVLYFIWSVITVLLLHPPPIWPENLRTCGTFQFWMKRARQLWITIFNECTEIHLLYIYNFLHVRCVCLVSCERLTIDQTRQTQRTINTSSKPITVIFSSFYFYDNSTFTWPKTDFDCTLLYHQFSGLLKMADGWILEI